jgi:hypothetical protein
MEIRLMKRLVLGLFALFWTGSLFAVEPELTVKVEKSPPPAELHDSIKALLSDDAIRVASKTEAHCTLWLRKEIPVEANADQVKNGLTYREIPRTTVIGAIELPQKWIDFRKQEIPKGVYTLRFVVQPQNGDHDGTAPHADFCLLSPAHLDQKPDAMQMKALIEMSATITGSTHPSVLLLFPNSKPEEQPKIVSKGNEILVVNVKRSVAAGQLKSTLGFGFTVAGHTKD